MSPLPPLGPAPSLALALALPLLPLPLSLPPALLLLSRVLLFLLLLPLLPLLPLVVVPNPLPLLALLVLQLPALLAVLLRWAHANAPVKRTPLPTSGHVGGPPVDGAPRTLGFHEVKRGLR